MIGELHACAVNSIADTLAMYSTGTLIRKLVRLEIRLELYRADTHNRLRHRPLNVKAADVARGAIAAEITKRLEACNG